MTTSIKEIRSIIVLIILLIFTTAWCVTIFFSLRLYYMDFQLKTEGIEIKGVITKFEITRGKGKTRYTPIINFRTESGIEIISKPIYYEQPYSDTPRSINIIYSKSNPNIFIIEGEKINYLSIFLIIALFPLVLYIILKNYLIDMFKEWHNLFKRIFA